MGKAGKTLGSLDKLLSVLERLGLWGPAAAAIITGAIGWIWSAMTSLPPPVIGLCVLFGAAGGLWLYNGLNDLAGQRKQLPLADFEAWDRVNVLTFSQIANLWVERSAFSSFNEAA